jgi:hypothetical protein
MVFLLRIFRKLYSLMILFILNSKIYFHLIEFDPSRTHLYEGYVSLRDKDANDYILKLLRSGKPCMISKFGTIELAALVQYKCLCSTNGYKEIVDYIKGKRPNLWWNTGIDSLCSNAGFFPNDPSLLKRYYEVNSDAIRKIDVLGSYIRTENFFKEELSNAIKVNIDGYYAPFFYKNPWTITLKGKNVLVIHPFAYSIQKQYKKRNLIWANEDVLPEFNLITIKAVQSMLGLETPYKDWFEALASMKDQLLRIDFDIAIIGCGAYGMPLAAFVKDIGKQAIHLAGWTQVLFGIKGKRWVDMQQVAKYMNGYWVHPNQSENVLNQNKIEQGCYW